MCVWVSLCVITLYWRIDLAIELLGQAIDTIKLCYRNLDGRLVLPRQFLTAVWKGACLKNTHGFAWLLFSGQWLRSIIPQLLSCGGRLDSIHMLPGAVFLHRLSTSHVYFLVSTFCSFIDTSIGEFVRWSFKYTDVLCSWREMPLASFVDIIPAYSKMLGLSSNM